MTEKMIRYKAQVEFPIMEFEFEVPKSWSSNIGAIEEEAQAQAAKRIYNGWVESEVSKLRRAD